MVEKVMACSWDVTEHGRHSLKRPAARWLGQVNSHSYLYMQSGVLHILPTIMVFTPWIKTWHKNHGPNHGIKTMVPIVATWRSRARQDWTANPGPFRIPSKSR